LRSLGLGRGLPEAGGLSLELIEAIGADRGLQLGAETAVTLAVLLLVELRG